MADLSIDELAIEFAPHTRDESVTEMKHASRPAIGPERCLRSCAILNWLSRSPSFC